MFRKKATLPAMKRLSKPIGTGLLLVTLILMVFISIGLYNYYTTNKIDWSKTKDVVDVLKNVMTIIAVGVGGVWAYFNFFKGRTYRSRLEPKVSGKLISRNSANYLVVTAQLKNIGLSDVRINQEGSAIRVFAYAVVEHTSKAHSVQQSRLITLPVFEEHGWIEPGELIEDQRLVAIPDIEYVALQTQLRLVSNKIEWNSAAIIEPPQLAAAPSNRAQLEPGTQVLLVTSGVGVSEDKKVTQATVGGTEDLAKITTLSEEDAAESRRIEEEKKPFEIMNIEKPVEAKEKLS